MTTTSSELTDSIDQIGALIARTATDPVYRATFLESPAAALESAGIAIPEAMTIAGAENSDGVRHLVLFEYGEMSAEDQQELQAMLSGTTTPNSDVDAWAKVVLDSWNDAALLARLQTDAVAVFRERGISLPSGVSLQTSTASDATVYAVVPPPPPANASPESIGEMAESITSSFTNLSKLITAGSYLAGLGFSIGAIMKFKQHKDNPTQIPIGTPIALVFIAAALLFLPTILGTD